MRELIGLVTFLGFIATTQAYDNFRVIAKFYDNEEFIGSSTLVVNPSKQATISVDGLYMFSLKLTPIDNSMINLATELELGGEHMTPSLVVELDKEASINIGDKGISVIVSKSSS